MYTLSAFAIGCLITLMNAINSALSLRVGNVASLVAIHLSGLAAVSVLLLRKEAFPGGRLPFYYYGAGVLGVGVVLASNLCFARLGASLSVGFALFGQIVSALVVDALGLFGLKRRGFGITKLVGPVIALLAVVIMAEGWSLGSPLILLAFFMGIFTLVGFGLNSHLAGAIGPLRATRVNYCAGLLTTAVVILTVHPALGALTGSFRTVSPLLIFGGGIMGVVMVAGMNRIFPRIPASSSTMLLFSGQVLAGLIFDAAVSGSVSLRRIAGAGLLISALIVKTMLDSRETRGPAPGV